MYYADNGSYPTTPAGGNGQPSNGSGCGWEQATGDNFIPGLSPKYISVLPQLPDTNALGDTYLYRSTDCIAYKLIRLMQGGLSVNEQSAMQDLMTTTCSASVNTDRWGYWSSDVSKSW